MSLAILTRADRRARADASEGPREPVFARTTPAPAPAKPAETRSGLPAASVDSAPTVRQFLSQLGAQERKLARKEALNAVIDVAPGEVEKLARLVARLRGRYLAKLIDLGNSTDTLPGELEIAEIRRVRERFEELEQGLAAVKTALSEGDLTLRGLRPE
ncbi:MAG TPA: hypothetical protein VHA10_09790 [Hypericibacter adhaerens]|jgi:hypothetical protein|uniref:Uncharacterized protein n=1 Tax=Hypericibacter adhaerens TaxID=2602016 RepID=A0A5J6MY10_9PROT|nr:hypothetical protein [Hypericibacter adhaerens]QEX22429.1 hypothetical protein FRZ61_23600 [Hypericibacter adhaerens]HWA43489.1 hypothetical protein [Hypericibacter adhaerens]